MPARWVATILLLVAASHAAAVQEQQSVTPIQKVIQMLNDMLAKGKAEKEDEEVQFAKFKQFCASTSKEKERSIAKATEQVEELNADIGQADADAAVLAKDIGSLDADVATWETELKESSHEREKAHADFVKTHEEYTESISAVERAVDTIKSGPGSLAQMSLLELSSSIHISAKAKSAIMSFVQMKNPETRLMQDAMEVEQPQANAFEGQSGGIVDMVKGLGNKFEEERDALEKGEMNEKHAFDMMSQDLTDQIENAQKNMGKKSSIKSQNEQDKASAEGDLAETSATLSEDKKILSDLTAECEQKSLDFEQRQEARQGEIEAIQQAIEIMSSDKVSGAGASLVQTSTSFAQLRTSSGSKAQSLVASFLADRARETNSRVLSLIADRAEGDPFKKVIKMIKDMITKLMEEATEEAEHKGFCDTEMGTNKMTRDSKSDEVASLSATIDELSADIAKLSEEMSALGDEISAIDASVAKATADRAAEKEKNTATIADSKVAQEAVAQALTVLKEFYDKAAAGAALSQTATKPEGPINYDKRALAILGGGGATAMVQTSEPYTGMANGGVMGMLEVIESDFARLLSETTASESEAASEFKEFSNDSAMDKATKGADMKNKGNERTRKESELQSAKKDLAGSQEELDAALAYFDKLKPSCVDAGETYEERVARRKEEIESLQEALKILSE